MSSKIKVDTMALQIFGHLSSVLTCLNVIACNNTIQMHCACKTYNEDHGLLNYNAIANIEYYLAVFDFGKWIMLIVKVLDCTYVS